MSVDRSGLQALIRDFGAVPPALQREFRGAGMRRAAQPALEEIRRRADWSTRIPAATTITASTGRAGVTIRTNATRAPHARPYEGLSGPIFRHPVYGNRHNWVPQAARPFFYSGAEAARPAVASAVGDIVLEVAARHGL